MERHSAHKSGKLRFTCAGIDRHCSSDDERILKDGGSLVKWVGPEGGMSSVCYRIKLAGPVEWCYSILEEDELSPLSGFPIEPSAHCETDPTSVAFKSHQCSPMDL